MGGLWIGKAGGQPRGMTIDGKFPPPPFETSPKIHPLWRAEASIRIGGDGWIGEVEGQRRGMTKMGWHCRLWGYCLLAQLATGGVQ